MSGGWVFCPVAGSMVSTCPVNTTVLTMSGGVTVNTSRTVRTATCTYSLTANRSRARKPAAVSATWALCASARRFASSAALAHSARAAAMPRCLAASHRWKSAWASANACSASLTDSW